MLLIQDGLLQCIQSRYEKYSQDGLSLPIRPCAEVSGIEIVEEQSGGDLEDGVVSDHCIKGHQEKAFLMNGERKFRSGS